MRQLDTGGAHELDAAKVRARVDRELNDDSVVPVLVIDDGATIVTLAGHDATAAVRALRLVSAQVRHFADQLEDERRRGGYEAGPSG